MISQKEITIDWLNKVSKENRNADKILVEKVIRALLLLEGLVKENLQFIFKGGTEYSGQTEPLNPGQTEPVIPGQTEPLIPVKLSHLRV